MKRITFIAGPTGSGKSTFVINFAIAEAKKHDTVNLVDLDYINVYFRSRSAQEVLLEHGVKMIGSAFDYKHQADLPAITGEIYTPFNNKSRAIYDLAGDLHGLNIVKAMAHQFEQCKDEIDFWLVINTFRPNTSDEDKIKKFITDAEEKSGLKVSGLIANPHLMGGETIDDIKEGLSIIKKVEKETNIPIIYIGSSKELDEENVMKYNIFPTN